MNGAWHDVVKDLEASGLPARVVTVREFAGPLWESWLRWLPEGPFRRGVNVDVRARGRSEEFVLLPAADARPAVLDRSVRIRHLLLSVRRDREDFRLLFGHDERHLFVANLPRTARVTRLRDAFETLRPDEVARAFAAGARVVRQGEWFFVPAPGFVPPAGHSIERNRWLGTKPRPHVVEESAWERTEDGRFLHHVRGRVRHPEHATVTLRGWHRVFRNRESGDAGAIAFRD